MALLMPDELEKKKREQGLVDTRTPAEALQSLLFQEPLSPIEQANKEYGKGETIMRRLGNLFTGGLFDSAIIPEMSSGSQAKYKTDLELWKEQQKLALVDPQNYALAAGIRAGKDPREIAALNVESSGATPYDINPTTLNRGDVMVDPFGAQIAAGAPYEQSVPASIQEFERWLVENPNANEKDRREAYNNIVVAPKTLNGTLVNGMTGAPVGGNLEPYLENTEDQAQAGEQGKNNADKIAGADAMYDLSTSIIESLEQLGTYDERTGEFIVGDPALDLYGFLDKAYPDALRFGEEAKANAIINKVLAQLKLSEREKLKGQGQISDSEQRILAESVSVLLSRGIPDELVQREIRSLLNFFIDRKDKADALRSPDNDTGGPVVNTTITDDPEESLDDLLERY